MSCHTDILGNTPNAILKAQTLSVQSEKKPVSLIMGRKPNFLSQLHRATGSSANTGEKEKKNQQKQTNRLSLKWGDIKKKLGDIPASWGAEKNFLERQKAIILCFGIDIFFPVLKALPASVNKAPGELVELAVVVKPPFQTKLYM